MKDKHYTKESDLPEDVVTRLKEINYPIARFLREVVFDSEASMREWLHCCEANTGKIPKDFKDRLAKMRRVDHHPSLNEYQRGRIEAYLKSGLSIRDVQRAVRADNFEVSFGTIKTIKKEIQKQNISKVENPES
jgi:hypothetical protein